MHSHKTDQHVALVIWHLDRSPETSPPIGLVSGFRCRNELQPLLTYVAPAVAPVDTAVVALNVLCFDLRYKTALTGIKTDDVWEYDINPLRELNMKHYELIDALTSRRDKKGKESRE